VSRTPDDSAAPIEGARQGSRRNGDETGNSTDARTDNEPAGRVHSLSPLA